MSSENRRSHREANVVYADFGDKDQEERKGSVDQDGFVDLYKQAVYFREHVVATSNGDMDVMQEKAQGFVDRAYESVQVLESRLNGTPEDTVELIRALHAQVAKVKGEAAADARYPLDKLLAAPLTKEERERLEARLAEAEERLDVIGTEMLALGAALPEAYVAKKQVEASASDTVPEGSDLSVDVKVA